MEFYGYPYAYNTQIHWLYIFITCVTDTCDWYKNPSLMNKQIRIENFLGKPWTWKTCESRVLIKHMSHLTCFLIGEPLCLRHARCHSTTSSFTTRLINKIHLKNLPSIPPPGECTKNSLQPPPLESSLTSAVLLFVSVLSFLNGAVHDASITCLERMDHGFLV